MVKDLNNKENNNSDPEYVPEKEYVSLELRTYAKIKNVQNRLERIEQLLLAKGEIIEEIDKLRLCSFCNTKQEIIKTLKQSPPQKTKIR